MYEYIIISDRHVRQQLHQYDDPSLGVSIPEKSVDKFTFHVKGLDAGVHVVILKGRVSATQEIESIVGQDMISFVILKQTT